MREKILKILHDIPANKHPQNVLLKDLLRELGPEVKPELRKMLNEGLIKAGPTVNDTYIMLNK